MTIRKVIQILSVCFLGLLLSGCFEEVLSGKVVDENGKPIKNVVVYIDNSNFVSSTDENGVYSIGNPGKLFTIKVFKKGYTSNQLPNVEINSDKTVKSLVLYGCNKNDTLENVAKSLLATFKARDYQAYKDNIFPTKEEIFIGIKNAKIDEKDKNSMFKHIEEYYYEQLGDNSEGWFRTLGEGAMQFDWAKAKFEKIEIESQKVDFGIPESDIKVFFTVGNKKVQMSLDDVVLLGGKYYPMDKIGRPQVAPK